MRLSHGLRPLWMAIRDRWWTVWTPKHFVGRVLQRDRWRPTRLNVLARTTSRASQAPMTEREE